MESVNPTRKIDVNFLNYVFEHQEQEENHLLKGIPDYAYAMDYELRKKLKELPGFYRLCKTMLATAVPRVMNQINLSGLLVGPNQFPDVYQMGLDCAKILGIGIPNIFIINDQTINAFTIASDDVAPIIVINSGLYERMKPGELKAVIGHECGHIHNGHTIFYYVINEMINQTSAGRLKSQIASLVTLSARVLMNSWIRTGEVTADRAALICSDNFEDAIQVNKKFLYGAAFGEHQVQLEPIRKQYEKIKETPVKLLELTQDHPLPARRIFAELEFMECEVLYKWRPDKKKAGMLMRDKNETDLRCDKILSVSGRG